MINSLTRTVKKTIAFTLIFSVFISFGSRIINAETYPSEWSYESPNNVNFQDIDVPILSNVWVAIATNIGTDFNNQKTSSLNQWGNTINSSFDETLNIKDMLNDPEKVRIMMIQNNMLTIKEYLAYLRNDMRANLDKSDNREAFLNEYTDQLEFRYKLASNNIKTLLSQKSYLESIITRSDNSIENIKLKLDSDFKAFDDRAVMADVENYLEQSRIKKVASTYLVFTNKFIEQYNYLNTYNKELLDVLILNKKAISTESYVVIPDSGSQILQDFNLLYDENAFKSQE